MSSSRDRIFLCTFWKEIFKLHGTELKKVHSITRKQRIRRKLSIRASLRYRWPFTTLLVNVAIDFVIFAMHILATTTLSYLCYLKHQKYVIKTLMCVYVIVGMRKCCHNFLNTNNLTADWHMGSTCGIHNC